MKLPTSQQKKIHTFISIICKLSNKKYVDNNNSNRNYHQEQELEPHQPNKRKEYDGNSFAYRISVNEWIARRNGSKCKIKRYNSNKCHLFSVFSLLLPFSFSNTSFCDFPSSCSPLIYLYERRACVCLARFWASQIFYATDWYRWILSIGMRKQYFYWIFYLINVRLISSDEQIIPLRICTENARTSFSASSKLSLFSNLSSDNRNVEQKKSTNSNSHV